MVAFCSLLIVLSYVLYIKCFLILLLWFIVFFFSKLHGNLVYSCAVIYLASSLIDVWIVSSYFLLLVMLRRIAIFICICIFVLAKHPWQWFCPPDSSAEKADLLHLCQHRWLPRFVSPSNSKNWHLSIDLICISLISSAVIFSYALETFIHPFM